MQAVLSGIVPADEEQDSQVAERIAYAMAAAFARPPVHLYGDCLSVVEDHARPARELLDAKRAHADKTKVVLVAADGWAAPFQ